MARRPELLAFAKQHGLVIITIADLITYREQAIGSQTYTKDHKAIGEHHLLDAAILYTA